LGGQIAAPVGRVAAGAEIPADISRRWLVEEAKLAMRQRLGPLRVSGPIGATPVTTFYADPQLRQAALPGQQLELGLRCMELFCVFMATRQWQGKQLNQQAVLFPDMSLQQWSDIVRRTTQALFP